MIELKRKLIKTGGNSFGFSVPKDSKLDYKKTYRLIIFDAPSEQTENDYINKRKGIRAFAEIISIQTDLGRELAEQIIDDTFPDMQFNDELRERSIMELAEELEEMNLKYDFGKKKLYLED